MRAILPDQAAQRIVGEREGARCIAIAGDVRDMRSISNAVSDDSRRRERRLATFEASSTTYFQAKIAHISPSATRTSLTQGSPKEATPAFFRVVPGDYIQGPSDANFMMKTLKVKKVVLLDFQEPYSVGLSDAIERVPSLSLRRTIR